MENSHKILFLDDNKNDILLIKEILEKYGIEFDLLEANNKKGFVKQLSKMPDLIIAEYHLPKFSGKEAIEMVKKRQLNIPIIILTAENDTTDILESIKDYAADLLIKDRLERLGWVVEQALEKKETQQALTAFETQYKNLFDKVPAGLYRSTPEGLLVEANQMTLDIYGLSSVPYDLSLIWADPGERKKWKQELKKHSVVEGYEIEYIKPDGTKIWVEENTRAVKDLDGEVIFYEGSIVNITEQKKAQKTLKENTENKERTLQESEALSNIGRNLNENLELGEIFQRIVDAAVQSIPNVGRSIIHLYDEEKQRLHGVAMGYPEESKTRPIVFPKVKLTSGGKFDFRVLDELIKEDAKLRSGRGIGGMVIESGISVIVTDTLNDERFVSAKTTSDIRSMVVAPIILNEKRLGTLSIMGNKPNAYAARDQDLLQRLCVHATTAIQNARLYQELENSLQSEKSTRSQLIQADKLAGMGRMVASVAHELNNPLQTIKNCLFLLEQNFKEDDSEMLELALSEVERLSGIVGNLREVYRPAMKDEMQELDIALLMADVQLLLETHLRRNNVELIYRLNGKEQLITWGVEAHLKQVFLNLSFNAIEAMQPKGGVLRIDLGKSENQDQVWVAFCDKGPGISEKEIKFIFDPFYTTKETGMGLGLSICYDIAQNHNGNITVHNNEDEGVTFTCWLPAGKGVREGRL